MSASKSQKDFIKGNHMLREIHQKFAEMGSSHVNITSEAVDLHFVALIAFNGIIWLLDGRNFEPSALSTIPAGDNENINQFFFENACYLVKSEFIDNANEKLNFSALLLIDNSL